MLVGYGKLGRSVPLTIDRAGSVGGDTEPVAVLRDLALRNPEHTFVILGRNSGENPAAIGLPSNIENPWTVWADIIREKRQELGVDHSNLSIADQQIIRHIYREITEPAFLAMHAHIWWVGQHGTSNTPLPRIEKPSDLTKPQDWCAHYASYVLQGINAWRDVDPTRRSEIWLNADPRNTHKMRDLKWPLLHPVLTQWNGTNNIKHARYSDDTFFDAFLRDRMISVDHPEHADLVWKSTTRNVYARMELCALMPGTPLGNTIEFNDVWHGRSHFGIVINECRKGVKNSRVDLMRDWVMPLNPDFIHGQWSDSSQSQLNTFINPIEPPKYLAKLRTTRTTFTTPASGTGWATSKPWEAFASGVVCFFHPDYDTQNHVLRDASSALRQWLRVKTTKELRERVHFLSLPENERTWTWLVHEQRDLFDRAVTEATHLELIEARMKEQFSVTGV